MKNISNLKISLIAVSVLILSQLSAIECVNRRIKCPETIPTECKCQSVSRFSYNCSKNNEEISLIDTTPAGNDDFRNLFKLELNCTKVTDGKIFESMSFSSKNSPYKNRVRLTINLCPMTVLSAIETSNIIASDSTYLDIVVNDLATMPESVFKNQTNLISLVLNGNELANLPEHIFDGLMKLRILSLNGNKFTALPKNIFQKLTDLSALEVKGNQLAAVPDDLFEGLSELGSIDFSGNKLTTLPENVFNGLNQLMFVFLGGNNLKTLPRNIFNSQIGEGHGYFILKGNPWVCDKDFVEIARELKNKIDYKDIICADGVPLEDKMNNSN